MGYVDHANLSGNPHVIAETRLGKERAYGAELELKKEKGQLVHWTDRWKLRNHQGEGQMFCETVNRHEVFLNWSSAIKIALIIKTGI